jgi:hypothetical protein
MATALNGRTIGNSKNRTDKNENASTPAKAVREEMTGRDTNPPINPPT